jgi:tripartite-type tricarboxylate transporter receptor subunit TctC
MIATRDMLSQPRDGYTLLLCTHFEAINTAAYKNVQFKLERSRAISLIAKYYYGLALANVIPADTIETFVQYAPGPSRRGDVRHHRRRLGAGDPGAAAGKLTGITMNRIPFRGGPQVVRKWWPARRFLRLADAGDRAAIRDKQLKILAVSAPERLKNLDIPTLTEGHRFRAVRWLGICAGPARRSHHQPCTATSSPSSPRPNTAR